MQGRLHRGRAGQGFLELFAGFEMGFAPGRDLDEFPGAGMAGRGLGAGVPHVQHAEASDLDPVAGDQRLAQGFEQPVHPLQALLVGATQGGCDGLG